MPIVRGIICEQCGTMIYWETNICKESIKAYARKKGWTIGKKCLCPDCIAGMKAGKGK